MRYWLAVLAFIAIPGPALADASEHMRQLAAQVLGELTGPMPAEQRLAGVRRMLQANFDARGTGRVALGRAGHGASAEERARFDAGFEAWMAQLFAGGLEAYGGEQIRFSPARPAGEGLQLVPSELQLADGPLLHIDWTLRAEGPSWRIVDFAVEGMGFAMLLRGGLQAAADRNGGRIDSLLPGLGGLPDIAKRR